MITKFCKQSSWQPKVTWIVFRSHKATLREIFSLVNVDETYNNALKFLFDSVKCGEAPVNEIQKSGRSPFLIRKYLK